MTKKRTWWGKEYAEALRVWEEFMQNVDNIRYELNHDNKDEDNMFSNPMFTITVKGKLKHYSLERADVDEHHEEIEEAIWGLRHE